MNKDVTALYVFNKNNLTVAFGNLKEAVTMLAKIEPEARNYTYYYRAIREVDVFEWKGYTLQRLI